MPRVIWAPSWAAGWRVNDYHTRAHTPAAIMILSVVMAVVVWLGATLGGTPVYDYGATSRQRGAARGGTGRGPTWSPGRTADRPARGGRAGRGGGHRSMSRARA